MDTDQGVEVLLGGSHLEGYTKPLGHLTSVGAQVVEPNNLEKNMDRLDGVYYIIQQRCILCSTHVLVTEGGGGGGS